jgi:site-specific DNA-methyltransferase (adenine-specific)
METFGKIQIVHADCMDIISALPDNAYDLAICDIPYGVGASEMNMGNGKNKKYKKGKKWDTEPPPPEYFRQLMRVTKNQIIFGGNYVSLPPSRGWIIWDKGIYGSTSFGDCELAWTSFDRVMRIARVRYSGAIGADEIRIHITQKPVNLYGWILNRYANPGDKILDTHLGGGSICIAADTLGFEMLGIEIDEDYYNAAKRRLQCHRAQLKLF